MVFECLLLRCPKLKKDEKDKLKGTNGAKFAVFQILLILAVLRDDSFWEGAEFCRKPLIFAAKGWKPLKFAEARLSHLP